MSTPNPSDKLTISEKRAKERAKQQEDRINEVCIYHEKAIGDLVEQFEKSRMGPQIVKPKLQDFSSNDPHKKSIALTPGFNNSIEIVNSANNFIKFPNEFRQDFWSELCYLTDEQGVKLAQRLKSKLEMSSSIASVFVFIPSKVAPEKMGGSQFSDPVHKTFFSEKRHGYMTSPVKPGAAGFHIATFLLITDDNRSNKKQVKKLIVQFQVAYNREKLIMLGPNNGNHYRSLLHAPKAQQFLSIDKFWKKDNDKNALQVFIQNLFKADFMAVVSKPRLEQLLSENSNLGLFPWGIKRYEDIEVVCLSGRNYSLAMQSGKNNNADTSFSAFYRTTPR